MRRDPAWTTAFCFAVVLGCAGKRLNDVGDLDTGGAGEGGAEGGSGGGAGTGGATGGASGGAQGGGTAGSSAEGGASGTASAGATSGGNSGAATGGTSGSGAGPPGNASCTLRYPPSDVTAEVSWNAETRTFEIGQTYWKLDANLWVIEKGDESGQWGHFMGYDELGTMSSFTYIWEGTEIPANSWDQTNEYEDGVLVSYFRLHRSADQQISETREYSQGLLARSNREQLFLGNLYTSSTEFVREGERVSVVRYESQGQVISTQTATYDRGYLTVLDWDGAGFAIADGTPDIRQRWEYDEAGRIIRFEQDGTTILDNPQIDGVPDETITFEPACAEIAVFPEELYRLPAWLAPRPGSGTWF